MLSAGTITGVCGTGFTDSTCSTLATSGVDPNWALTSAPETTQTSGDAYITGTGAFPFPPWVANTSSAQWISPFANEGGGRADLVGTYVYTEVFSLSGYNLATVDLTGMFANDNNAEIILNGVDTTIGHVGLGSFSSTFNITSGFNAGSNTIQFDVTNTSVSGAGPNPTGLIVELTGTGTLATVPEPASFAFIGLGLGALGLLGRRLRS